jgi:CRISPR/Cas system-associated exonuclease Cas4 (RecB family)
LGVERGFPVWYTINSESAMSADLPPPGLPEGFLFSQSSLQDYADCPRRFRLRYLERLAWPAIESEPALENERRQQEGQRFHLMVQQHRIGLPAERLTPLADTPDLQRWWRNYLESDLGLDGCRLFSELTLSAAVPVGEQSWRVLAKYDLLAIRPGEKAVIFDWKTYRRRPRDEHMAARWQTRVYRALLVQAGAQLNGGTPFSAEQVEMVYWYADFPSEPARFPYSADQLQRDLDGLKKLIEEIAAARTLEMTDDERQCAYCPYRSYCDRGVQAAPGGEVETEQAGMDLSFDQVQEIQF